MGALVGVHQVGVLAHAAGSEVLHNHTSRLLVLAHGRPCGVHVQIVVVRHLLALVLSGAGQGMLGPLVAIAHVEGCLLMRVLAIAQVLLLGKPQRLLGGKALPFQLGAQPRGDGPVVGGSGTEHLQRQRLAGAVSSGTAVGAHLLQNALIGSRIDDHGHRSEVLGSRAQHGGAADVDVLDAGAEVGPGGHRLIESVEVHHHHVNHLDAMIGRLLHVGRVVALGQKPAVHPRMKGFHAPVHHFGEFGHRVDGGDRNARFADDLGGAAGGDDLAPELIHQGAGEIDHAGFVGHRHQYALDGRIFSHEQPFYLGVESVDGKRIAQTWRYAPKSGQTA